MTADSRLEPDVDAAEVPYISMSRDSRIMIEGVTPVTNCGASSVQTITGEWVKVTCQVFVEGGGPLAVMVRWRHIDSSEGFTAPMQTLGNNLWQGQLRIDTSGLHVFCIDAWVDEYASLCFKLQTQFLQGSPVGQVIRRGLDQVLLAAQRWVEDPQQGPSLQTLYERLSGLPQEQQIALLLHEDSASLMRDAQERSCLALSPEYPLYANAR